MSLWCTKSLTCVYIMERPETCLCVIGFPRKCSAAGVQTPECKPEAPMSRDFSSSQLWTQRETVKIFHHLPMPLWEFSVPALSGRMQPFKDLAHPFPCAEQQYSTPTLEPRFQCTAYIGSSHGSGSNDISPGSSSDLWTSSSYLWPQESTWEIVGLVFIMGTCSHYFNLSYLIKHHSHSLAIMFSINPITKYIARAQHLPNFR